MAEPEDSVSDRFVDDSRRLFDASVDELDGATLTRLRTSRQRALRNLRPFAWLKAPSVWLPAAVATALVVVLIPPWGRQDAPPAQRDFAAVASADLELLLGDEELEMLAEFEFYEWLDLESVGAPESQLQDGVG